ncbi:hydroxysteroid dehydrogenase 2 [Labeo rohita]|uniref:Hydroxysteroid dehydrogenase-like protein 2 n=2 Tax=Labeo rohita TaxID=84645 RepID=A0ABQ8MDP8_LABRO|nr:hydroxysteroid dehydrogenase-like protein 2 [Labeo rohita]KAI2659983.1 Hydroxysteroid dehydrogenase-like protein 2 [Labeo rohita]RXN21354.1 hydroxysteroid dehydrogenase 2 [Labeo rohita]
MLQNTGKLAGCTVFITGASRGIGKAIALKAARDGANVVIAAKTADPHPKLPGTIYTAAAEIEAAGGKALPCIVDVRDENQINQAVEQAVKTFGGIDILVNNASAINLTGTLETPMKKVDLMLGINLRGTYLTSKLCIPHLLKSKNPHILNLSPPLNLNPIWFKNHTAYTMAKYGMSMCVLGMAEEFKGSIAVNALWPRTAIQTAAMDMLGGSGIGKQCRKVEIMADAAYAILKKPTSYTGQFVIDEDILKKEGIKDFDVYAVEPGHPLLPDFFLDEQPEDLAKQMEEHGATPAFKSGKASTDSAATGPISDMFNIIRGILNPDIVKTTQGVYKFDLSGEHAGVWYIDLKNDAGSAGSGEPPVKADVVMTLDSADFIKMFGGKLKPTMAFMSGKLKIKGDMGLAIKLEKMMAMMKSKL